MRPTKKCVALWGSAVVLWVFSMCVAVWVADPSHPNPWWLTIFRGPMWAATWAGYVVSLVLHHLLGDRGTMFKIALQLGREEAWDDVARRGPNVLPMQERRRSHLS